MNTIISHPNFLYLWEDIAKNMKLNHINIKFDKFPDLWPNIFIENVKDKLEHKEVTYIWDFSNSNDLFFNYSIIRWILDYYVDKLRIIMPYFPVWTMERIDTKWQIATAKYFADIFSQIPSGRVWKTSIHTFDIHALVERFLFDSYSVNAEMHTTMNLLEKNIIWKTIVFPDDWAYKRFEKYFKKFEIIICSKVRQWDKRIITIKEWNPKWKDTIIIDDLIQSWWTIKNTALKLRELWAKSVDAFATHWIFPNKSHINLSKYLDNLIVTDTIPENINRSKEIKNMKILNINKLIEKII